MSDRTKIIFDNDGNAKFYCPVDINFSEEPIAKFMKDYWNDISQSISGSFEEWRESKIEGEIEGGKGNVFKKVGKGLLAIEIKGNFEERLQEALDNGNPADAKLLIATTTKTAVQTLEAEGKGTIGRYVGATLAYSGCLYVTGGLGSTTVCPVVALGGGAIGDYATNFIDLGISDYINDKIDALFGIHKKSSYGSNYWVLDEGGNVVTVLEKHIQDLQGENTVEKSLLCKKGLEVSLIMDDDNGCRTRTIKVESSDGSESVELVKIEEIEDGSLNIKTEELSKQEILEAIKPMLKPADKISIEGNNSSIEGVVLKSESIEQINERLTNYKIVSADDNFDLGDGLLFVKDRTIDLVDGSKALLSSTVNMLDKGLENTMDFLQEKVTSVFNPLMDFVFKGDPYVKNADGTYKYKNGERVLNEHLGNILGNALARLAQGDSLEDIVWDAAGQEITSYIKDCELVGDIKDKASKEGIEFVDKIFSTDFANGDFLNGVKNPNSVQGMTAAAIGNFVIAIVTAEETLHGEDYISEAVKSGITIYANTAIGGPQAGGVIAAVTTAVEGLLNDPSMNSEEYQVLAISTAVSYSSAAIGAYCAQVFAAVGNAIVPVVGGVIGYAVGLLVGYVIYQPLSNYYTNNFEVMEDTYDAFEDFSKQIGHSFDDILHGESFKESMNAILDEAKESIKELLEAAENFVEGVGHLIKDVLIGIYDLCGGDYGKKLSDGEFFDPYDFLKIVAKEDGLGNIIYALEEGTVAIADDFADDDLYGSEGDNSLVGKEGKNKIMGRGGNDHIEGRGNEDIIFGGEGHDQVEAGAGDDKVFGEAGNDFIKAGDGNDIVMGGAGDDTILGGDGDDQIQCDGEPGEDNPSGKGNDYADGGAGNDTILGGKGEDILVGGLGDDSLLGEMGDDILSGDEGNDLLDGGDGADIILGGAGSDDLTGGLGHDEVFGGEGSDILRGDSGDDIMDGGADSDLVFGGISNDVIYGNDGDDHLYGEIGNDYVMGGIGNDIIDGYDGDDVLMGGKGNDAITAGLGNDTIVFVAGDGNDIIGGAGKDGAIDASDKAGNDVLKLVGIDIDAVSFDYNDINDSLVLKISDANGKETGDKITIKGQMGGSKATGSVVDKIEFDDGSVINLSQLRFEGEDVICPIGNYRNVDTTMQAELAQAYEDNFINMQNEEENPDSSFYETNYDTEADQVADNEHYNAIQWRSRKKKRSCFGGHYTVWYQYQEHNLNGTEGNDRIVGNYWWENINGGVGDDQLYGNGGNDTVHGGAGDDYLSGGTGNDTLNGGVGHDKIIGGTGNDTLNGGYGNDFLDGQQGNDTLNGGANDDKLIGGSGNDTLDGGDGHDILDGVDGRDTISGGDGNDFVKAGSGDDIIRGGNGNDTLIGHDGADKIYGESGNDTIYAREDDDVVEAGAGNDYVSGGSGNDYIYGQGGHDELYGDGGADKIEGGTGNDSIFGGSDNDLLKGQEGDDTIGGGSGNDWIEGGIGNDTIYGDSGADIIYAGEGNDRIEGGFGGDEINGGAGNDIINGGAGNDIIIDGVGSDTMSGGAGKDLFILTREDSQDIDIIEDFNYQEDRIVLKVSYKDPVTLGKMKRMMTQDGDDINLMLNNGKQIIIKNSQIGRLSDTNFAVAMAGGENNDVLFGTEGDDVLFGGTGDDDIYGGKGDDELWGNLGVDRLYGEEGDDLLMYSADGRYINDSTRNYYNRVNSSLNGYNYTLDTFDGGEGDDTLLMTEGDDFLALDGRSNEEETSIRKTLNDVNVIHAGNGNDIVNLSTNTFEYTEELTIYGGQGSDRIWSSEGGDTVYGQEGADEIYGGKGSDIISGGIGDDYINGWDGDDMLEGNSGNDTIEGGLGNDTIYGGSGDDVIRGGNYNIAAQEEFTKSNPLSESNGWADGSNNRFVSGDFNNDGFDDIATFNHIDRNSTWIAYSNGDGSFTKANPLSESNGWADGSNNRFVSGDFNNDGFDDIATFNHNTSKYSWIAYSNGDGSFTKANPLSESNGWADGSNNRFVSGDFNNDGFDDIATFNSSSNSKYSWIAYSNGDGTFAKSHTLSENNGWFDGRYSRFVSGDFNGDGNDDIASFNHGDSKYSWIALSNGDGTFEKSNPLHESNGWLDGGNNRFVSGDFNGDGFDDIATFNHNTSKYSWIAYSNGDGSFTKANPLSESNGWADGSNNRFVSGDFNNDGFDDIATFHHINRNSTWIAYSNRNLDYINDESSDNLYGGAGDDTIEGGSGDDYIDGGEDDDILNGGTGDDKVFGGNGNDVLDGYYGNDYLNGGAGDDILDGHFGDDVLDGGSGDDYINASLGNDILTGGLGNDIFSIAQSANDTDTIKDFQLGVDKIELDYNNAVSFNYIKEMSTQDGDNLIINLQNGQKVVVENVNLNDLSADDFIFRGESIVKSNNHGITFDDFLSFDAEFYLEQNPDVASNAKYGNNPWGHFVEWGYNEGRIPNRYFNSQYYLEKNPDVANNAKYGGRPYKHFAEWGKNENRNFTEYVLIDGKYYLNEDEAGLIEAGSGNDTIHGLNANDEIYAGAGNDTIRANNGNDLIYAEAGNDNIDAGAGNDKIFGGEGSDIINGASGDDIIHGNEGNDDIHGGIGDDEMHGDDGDDTIHGNKGNDLIYGGDGNDRLHSQEGDDIVYAGNGNDYISAWYGNDYVDGGDGNDKIDGNKGNDELAGNSGNDTIYGGDGDDIISGGTGSDILDGGAGNDILSYEYAEGNLEINLADNSVAEANGDIDTISNFENVITGQGDDFVIGDVSNNNIQGGAGDDFISGASGNDALIGNTGNDTLKGGLGNDYLRGGAGADILDGGSGNDIVSYYTSEEGVEVDLEAGIGKGGDAEGDTLINIERINGSYHNDILFGSNKNDEIRGLKGSDTIYGRDGDDVLYGGSAGSQDGGGYNAIYGGNGNDTIYSDYGNDFLDGGASDDTYHLLEGFGHDVISETEGGYDTIILPDFVTIDNVSITKRGNDLTIRILGKDDTLDIKDFFGEDGNKIENLIVSGQSYSLNNLRGTEGQDKVYSVGPNIIVDEDSSVLIDFLPEVVNGKFSIIDRILSSDAANGSIEINEFNKLSYTPNSNFNGTDTITYTISDGNGGEVIKELIVTVNNINDAPITELNSAVVNEDTSVTLDVIAQASDIDGDTLTISEVTDGINGIATIVTDENGNQTINYTPNNNFNGIDTITYTVSDGNGGEITKTVNVVVNSVNDEVIINTDIVEARSFDKNIDASVGNEVNVDLSGLFSDADVESGFGDDALTHSLEILNGDKLPSWLNFNADTMTLTGTVPSNITASELKKFNDSEFVLEAYDKYGSSKQVQFDLSIDPETISITENGSDNDDTLVGNKGNDTLSGGLGNDSLIGGKGDDVIYGDTTGDNSHFLGFNTTKNTSISALNQDKSADDLVELSDPFIKNQFVADFDGDGVNDVANISSVRVGGFFGNNMITADVNITNTIGSSKWIDGDSGMYWHEQKWMSGDFNGDGKDDLVNVFGENDGVSADVKLSTGTDFNSARWMTQSGGYWDAQKWLVGDFNGDGRDDLVNIFEDRGGASADVKLSTEEGFVSVRWMTGSGGYWDAQKWLVGDFNGDGRDDLANIFDDGGRVSIDVKLSSDSYGSDNKADSFVWERWTTKSEEFDANKIWTVEDLDSDGVSELVSRIDASDSSSIIVYENDAMDHDKLYGNEGDDILKGGHGNDMLEGGLGADSLFGGQGSDTFSFINLNDSSINTSDLNNDSLTYSAMDTIHDFKQGFDAIDLRALGFDGIVAGDGYTIDDNGDGIVDYSDNDTNVLGYHHDDLGNTIIEDSNSDFAIKLIGEYDLSDDDLMVG